MKCNCPKGYPKTEWEPYQVLRPSPTDWRLGLLFVKHTGKCPLCDELLDAVVRP